MTLKRTSPGPNIGGVGSGKGAPKSIGMKGNTGGQQSTSGGQYDFLPSPKSNAGNAPRKGGQSSGGGRENTYDFLPSKPKK